MASFKNDPFTLIRLTASAWILAASGVQAFAQATNPMPPKPSAQAAVRDLAQVPELVLDEKLAKPIESQAARSRLSMALQDANRLNKDRIDGFVADLIKNRADLKGLPFVMGDDCRMTNDRQRPFAMAGESVHQAVERVKNSPKQAGTLMMDAFQRNYWELDARESGLADSDNLKSVLPTAVWMALQMKKLMHQKQSAPETAKRPVGAAQVAALMQVLAPERAELRVALAYFLGRIPHPEAARALARLAIFSDEVEVRQAACQALQLRNGSEYGDILIQGLDYPLPEVAERVNETIARLKRADLIPQLVAVLERPDPDAPKVKDVGGAKVVEVREVVRVNHHRNCLLCHAPGNATDVPVTAIKAEMPVPGQPLPSHSGYQSFGSDFVVRIDVTYLRQDFSRFMPVDNSGVWPSKQRFDFMVRTRTLTDEQAKAHLERDSAAAEGGSQSRYHRAAIVALRELTGQDADPTAAAWRRILKERR